MEVKIKVRNFSKWQKTTGGRREWFALDVNFFLDPKIRNARQLCSDAPDCFIALWREVDQNGEVTMSLEALKSYWKLICCTSSNRFDVQKRLDALSKMGLIEFQLVSNDVLNESQCDSNELLIDFQSCSNEVLTEFKDPLEPPQTHVALSKNNTNNTDITNKAVVVNDAKSPNSNGCFFKIKRPFEEITEEDWIRRQLIDDIRHRDKKYVDDALSIHELGVMYSGVKKRVHSWLSNPIDKRIAAFIYAASKPNITGELSYATKAIMDNYEGYLKYLQTAEEMVRNGDYEVELDG